LDVAAVESQAPVPRASAKLELEASASEPPPATSTLLSKLSETNPPSALRFHVAGVVAAPAEDVSAQARAKVAVPTAANRIRPLMLHYPFRPHIVGIPLHGEERGFDGNLAPRAREFLC
jgi:hypothetical protein